MDTMQIGVLTVRSKRKLIKVREMEGRSHRH